MDTFISSLSLQQIIIGIIVILLAFGLIRFFLRMVSKVIGLILTLVVLAAAAYFLLNLF